MESENTFEFSDYFRALNQRRHLIAGIWLPIVLIAALLAVGLPNEYTSTAMFQLKVDPAEDAKGVNYADRYVSALNDSVLKSEDLRAALKGLAPYPRIADDPSASLQKLKGDVSVDMVTQKILDPVSGLQRNINTGFTVSYDNHDPERA